MKRIGHIYEKIKSEENIRQAIFTAAKGKTYRAAVKTVLADVDKHVGLIKDMLENKTYTPCEVKERDVIEGARRKKRHITTIAFFPDQIIHWCVIRQLQPYFIKWSYPLSCGSMPLRGSHYAKKFIGRWLRHDPGKTRYCAKLDISHFYPSVPHSVVMETLKRKFKDKDLLELLEKIIGHWHLTTSFDGDDIGIPIGFLTSQWLANFILTPVDHVIKQKARIPYYVRYMDDMILFGADTGILRRAVRHIVAELWNRGMRIKKNWQIFKTDSRPVDVLGFRFYRGYTTLRKALMLRISRKASAVKHKYAPTLEQARSIMSYMGWIRHSDSYKFFKTRIEPFINIKRARKIISKGDKNESLPLGIGNKTRTSRYNLKPYHCIC